MRTQAVRRNERPRLFVHYHKGKRPAGDLSHLTLLEALL